MKLSAVIIASFISFSTVTAAWAEPVSVSAPVTKVDPKRVCMVNETFFDRDQIAVEVGGKTYYGCCPMCKTRLASDRSIRVAVDPISGREVDKALAVIGALPDQKVLYFESQKNLDTYNARASRSKGR